MLPAFCKYWVYKARISFSIFTCRTCAKESILVQIRTPVLSPEERAICSRYDSPCMIFPYNFYFSISDD